VSGNSFSAWELGYAANATVKADPKDFLGSSSYWFIATEMWARDSDPAGLDDGRIRIRPPHFRCNEPNAFADAKIESFTRLSVPAPAVIALALTNAPRNQAEAKLVHTTIAGCELLFRLSLRHGTQCLGRQRRRLEQKAFQHRSRSEVLR
jgi:hypothetical protein